MNLQITNTKQSRFVEQSTKNRFFQINKMTAVRKFIEACVPQGSGFRPSLNQFFTAALTFNENTVTATRPCYPHIMTNPTLS